MKEQSEQNVKVLRHNNFCPATDITDFPISMVLFLFWSLGHIHIYVETILEKKNLRELLKARFVLPSDAFKRRFIV